MRATTVRAPFVHPLPHPVHCQKGWHRREAVGGLEGHRRLWRRRPPLGCGAYRGHQRHAAALWEAHVQCRRHLAAAVGVVPSSSSTLAAATWSRAYCCRWARGENQRRTRARGARAERMRGDARRPKSTWGDPGRRRRGGARTHVGWRACDRCGGGEPGAGPEIDTRGASRRHGEL